MISKKSIGKERPETHSLSGLQQQNDTHISLVAQPFQANALLCSLTYSQSQKWFLFLNRQSLFLLSYHVSLVQPFVLGHKNLGTLALDLELTVTSNTFSSELTYISMMPEESQERPAVCRRVTAAS